MTLGLPDGLRTLPVRIADGAVDVAGGPRAGGAAVRSPVRRLGVGYGSFELDAGSLDYLLAHLPEISDPLARGAAWVTLWDQMLDRRASPAALITLALAALPRETDEQNVQRILNYAEQAYWRFLPAAERPALTPKLENTLRAGLAKAGTASLKSAWFSALRDVAQSPSVVGWLGRVWSRTTEVPGLTLAEPDYITLAQRLALLQPARAAAILDAQAARITNPDRRERFVYVQPSISPDQAVRDAFFAKLKDPAFRQREPWVLEALSYLHDPLRAQSSEKYIPDSLNLLRGHSAYRRHLLPEAMDGRDARRPQLCQRRTDGETVHGRSAARVSGPPPARHSLGVRRSVSRQRRRAVTAARRDRTLSDSVLLEPGLRRCGFATLAGAAATDVEVAADGDHRRGKQREKRHD